MKTALFELSYVYEEIQFYSILPQPNVNSSGQVNTEKINKALAVTWGRIQLN